MEGWVNTLPTIPGLLQRSHSAQPAVCIAQWRTKTYSLCDFPADMRLIGVLVDVPSSAVVEEVGAISRRCLSRPCRRLDGWLPMPVGGGPPSLSSLPRSARPDLPAAGSTCLSRHLPHLPVHSNYDATSMLTWRTQSASQLSWSLLWSRRWKALPEYSEGQDDNSHGTQRRKART